MIITSTPLRISFTGGGSDFHEYYSQYGGAVLSATINKYIYLSLHPYFFKNGYLLKYSKHENVDQIDKIEHRIIRQVFYEYGIVGVDFNSSSDIPSGTGLGSSSAFTVGLINLCNVFTEKYMSKNEIAKYACEIEIDKLKDPIGKQDQFATAIGGLNLINFNIDETVSVEKVPLTNDGSKKLQKNLLMFYTGITRASGSILIGQRSNIVNDEKTIKNLNKMVSLSYQLKDELCKNNIDALGEILNISWNYKKELAMSITNEVVDHYYNLALENGATGGKLLGAGGGGFLLFYVKEENQERLRKALFELRELEFEFEAMGTSVIYQN